MILPVVLYGNPILETISAEVDQQSKSDIQRLIDDMFETMHRANGVGLAAVQVGVPLRLFVVEAHLPDEDFHLRGVFINPKIIREFGDPVKYTEGCLSFPGLAGNVERPSSIEMEYLDEEWKPQKKVFDGFAARIIQHEYDHLEGKVYVDKLDTMWQKAMEGPIEQIKKREIKPAYLWK
jgi:peptide deformylase